VRSYKMLDQYYSPTGKTERIIVDCDEKSEPAGIEFWDAAAL